MRLKQEEINPKFCKERCASYNLPRKQCGVRPMPLDLYKKGECAWTIVAIQESVLEHRRTFTDKGAQLWPEKVSAFVDPGMEEVAMEMIRAKGGLPDALNQKTS